MKEYEENIGRGAQKCWHLARARKLALVAIVLVVVLVVPQSSESQILPSPCCAILSAGLGSIASAITNVVAARLMHQFTMTSIEAFQRTVVWPQNLINQAKGVVGSIQESSSDPRTPTDPCCSATLPSTQKLEETLLSATQASSLSRFQYATVYSASRHPTDASPQVRDLIDMTDAAAQAAMKRAIAIDAIAIWKCKLSDRIIQEVQAAAPGPRQLSKRCGRLVGSGKCYTQGALTELMRLRAIDLANAGAEMKLESQQGTTLRGNVTDALKRR